MVDQREATVAFIKANGPTLPVQIAKHLTTSILFASAILSELVSRKLLKLSHKNVGGSPVYFLPGQEELVCRKLEGSLKAQEKDLVKKLFDQKALYANYLEPWERISLAELKDFAVQLEVISEGTSHKFWKHFLHADEEVKPLIKQTLENAKPQAIVAQITPQVPTQTLPDSSKSFAPQEQGTEKSMVKTLEEKRGDILPQADIEQLKAELMKEMRKELIKSMQVQIPEKKEEPEKKKIEGKLYEDALKFFKTHKIDCLEEKELRKGELDFITLVPTNLGSLKYYVKVKDKKVINDGDISAAFSDGQLKQLPILLIASGKLTKKAEELLSSKFKDQMVFRKL